MVKMTAVYAGGLHCELTHLPSGSVLETDAPKDNMGRGERFSPTDLVGAALASCILTTMAIAAERDQMNLTGAKADVTKNMITTPHRRIGDLTVTVTLPASLPPDYRKKLEGIAHTCPVHRSLHPEVKIPISFTYA